MMKKKTSSIGIDHIASPRTASGWYVQIWFSMRYESHGMVDSTAILMRLVNDLNVGVKDIL